MLMIGMVHAQNVLEDGDGEVEYKTSIAMPEIYQITFNQCKGTTELQMLLRTEEYEEIHPLSYRHAKPDPLDQAGFAQV